MSGRHELLGEKTLGVAMRVPIFQLANDLITKFLVKRWSLIFHRVDEGVFTATPDADFLGSFDERRTNSASTPDFLRCHDLNLQPGKLRG